MVPSYITPRLPGRGSGATGVVHAGEEHPGYREPREYPSSFIKELMPIGGNMVVQALQGHHVPAILHTRSCQTRATPQSAKQQPSARTYEDARQERGNGRSKSRASTSRQGSYRTSTNSVLRTVINVDQPQKRDPGDLWILCQDSFGKSRLRLTTWLTELEAP